MQKANEEGTPFPDINYSYLLGDFSGGLHDWNGFPLSRLQGAGEEYAMFDLLGRRAPGGGTQGELRSMRHLLGNRSKSNHASARFERSALPSDIGGELTTGTDGHCCLGVEQPALCDEDAVWAKYLS